MKIKRKKQDKRRLGRGDGKEFSVLSTMLSFEDKIIVERVYENSFGRRKAVLSLFTPFPVLIIGKSPDF